MTGDWRGSVADRWAAVPQWAQRLSPALLLTPETTWISWLVSMLCVQGGSHLLWLSVGQSVNYVVCLHLISKRQLMFLIALTQLFLCAPFPSPSHTRPSLSLSPPLYTLLSLFPPSPSRQYFLLLLFEKENIYLNISFILLLLSLRLFENLDLRHARL